MAAVSVWHAGFEQALYKYSRVSSRVEFNATYMADNYVVYQPI